MKKIRKAIAAFVTATLGAVVTKVVTDGVPDDTTGWLALAGAAVGVGVAAGLAVWRVPNSVRPATDPVRRTY